MNRDVEAGVFAIVLLGGGVALSLGLAFGVLHVTVHAMSAARVSTTSGAELNAASLALR
jgi:hypothetical protein